VECGKEAYILKKELGVFDLFGRNGRRGGIAFPAGDFPEKSIWPG